MIAAPTVHSIPVFIAGLAVFAVGAGCAMRVDFRYPEAAQARARGRDFGAIWYPVYFFMGFGWLLSDTRAALRERQRHAEV